MHLAEAWKMLDRTCEDRRTATCARAGKKKAEAAACCWLLLLLAAAGCCCWLLLLAAAAAGCCWLLLLLAAAAGCCWLLLLLAAAAAGCCWLLLLLLAAAGCCCFCWVNVCTGSPGQGFGGTAKCFKQVSSKCFPGKACVATPQAQKPKTKRCRRIFLIK